MSFSQNPRSDKFKVFIPDEFFKPEICNKFNQFLSQKDYVLEDIQSVLRESLQSIESPEFGYTPITQNTIDGANAGYDVPQISKDSVQKLTEKTFAIVYRHTDGFMTYFMMLEHFFKRYKFGPDGDRKPFGTIILETQLPDSSPLCRIKYRNCNLIGVNGLALTYASPTREFNTFTCTFSYSEFETTFELPELKLKN